MNSTEKNIIFKPVFYNKWEKYIYERTEKNPKIIEPLNLRGLGGSIIYICVFFSINLFCAWLSSSSLLAIISLVLGVIMFFCMVIDTNSVISYVSADGDYIYKIWKPIDYITEHVYKISEIYILIMILWIILYGIILLYKYFI